MTEDSYKRSQPHHPEFQKKLTAAQMMYGSKILMLTFILMLLNGTGMKAAAQSIPYPDALNDAAVVQPSISNLDKNGIIIGNGDINALIFSQNGTLVMHLAKNNVWDARLITEDDPPLLKVNIEEHTWTGGGRPPSWNKPYPTQTPPAVIRIPSAGNVKNTRLDLQKGVATIVTDSDSIRIRALAQNNVYLIQTNRKVEIEGFPQDFLPQAEKKEENQFVMVKQHFPGDPDYPGMDVFSVLETRDNLHAIAVVTSRESSDALSDAHQLVKDVLEQEPSATIKTHEKEWQEFWSRSGIRLSDDDLQNWWYRQLYYFRCLSKPGAYAIALQGGYNSKANWHGTWTMNYNAEQTFWTAFNSNHIELAKPYIDLVNAFHPRAQWYAQTVFNCEGAVSPHNLWPFEPDPTACTSVNKRQLAFMPWSYGIGTAGHMAHNLWLYYLYSGDTGYLREKIYPIIKDYAIFYTSFAEKCKISNGRVIFGPSVDPEHTPFGWDNSPYDLAWAKHTLNAAISGAHILGVDADWIKRWTDTYNKLPYYPISEGVVKVEDKEKGYNIITPLVPVFPAEQITWFSSEDEKALFQRSIKWMESRYNKNNSVVMLNVARARLSMTNDAFTDTRNWFKSKEQPNGLFYWQAHGYYMTEQTAVAGLINELLIQSVGQTVRIFPAWPKSQDAEFTNLRTQGGFLISATQKNGAISEIKVESTAGGELKLLNPWDNTALKLNDGTVKLLIPDSLNVVHLSTTKGQIIEFVKNE